MPNRSKDALFQLIKSLGKAEKRNFKLFARRLSTTADLKTVQLFDAIDKMDEYNEAVLLKRSKHITKQQLSNTKASLYKQVLASLRSMRDDDNLDIQLHELMDYARILYNKGLYLQSLQVLEKLKEQAKAHHQITYCLQAVIFEKHIESLHITRSMENRAERLAKELDILSQCLAMVNKLSNLSLQLYSWYIRLGHARNSHDRTAIKAFFESNLPSPPQQYTTFYERLYLHQSYAWYSFIVQDFLAFYRNTQKWVDLFEAEPGMKKVETMHYIKGIHNLLTAHFMLRNVDRFNTTLQQFEQFTLSKDNMVNENCYIQSFVYLHTAKINKHFIEGTFTEGLALIPHIEDKLEEYHLHLDRHRVLVFYYKIACLYFGSGNNKQAIDYLNKIIHWKMDLRTDIQCYSRLLHLIAHYELGNYDLTDYLVKSVYRFMNSMDNLSVVEEEILGFLRRSFHLQRAQLQTAFKQLLDNLLQHRANPYESRAYMYLDIISWLESKITNVPVQNIIRHKYEELYEQQQKKIERRKNGTLITAQARALPVQRRATKATAKLS